MKAWHAMVFYVIFFVVAAAVVCGVVFRKPLSPSTSPYVTARAARDLVTNGTNLMIIDVSPYYFKGGHLPGAVNYPKCAISSVISKLNRDSVYLVYCHGFGSPMGSVDRLRDAGFRNVYALLGNFGAWVDAGYPVEN